jgi:hypothetical protein
MRILAITLSAMLVSAGFAHAQPAPNRTAPSSTSAPNRSATDQFSSAGNVVWFNTKSKVYHFAGTRDYGKTKSGAYMCQPMLIA